MGNPVSDREADVQHISVRHDCTASAPGGRGRAPSPPSVPRLQQRRARNHLRADEAARQVGMDLPRRRHGVVAAADRPRLHFVFAHGEEADEAEQIVDRADQPRTVPTPRCRAPRGTPPPLRVPIARPRVRPPRRSAPPAFPRAPPTLPGPRAEASARLAGRPRRCSAQRPPVCYRNSRCWTLSSSEAIVRGPDRQLRSQDASGS